MSSPSEVKAGHEIPVDPELYKEPQMVELWNRVLRDSTTLDQLHAWAFAFLVKYYPNPQKRISYEDIGEQGKSNNLLSFFHQLYFFAQRRGALNLLTQTYGGRQNSTEIAVYKNWIEQYFPNEGTTKVTSRVDTAKKEEAFNCAYCGTEQTFSIAQGNIARAVTCPTCGVKLEFSPAVKRKSSREKKLLQLLERNPGKTQQQLVSEQIALIDNIKSESDLRPSFKELADRMLYDEFQMRLWCDRVVIALDDIRQATLVEQKQPVTPSPIPQDPSHLIAMIAGTDIMREIIKYVVSRVGGVDVNDKLRKTVNTLLYTIQPLQVGNRRWSEQSSENPNLVVRFCGKCHDVFPVDTAGGTFDGMDQLHRQSFDDFTGKTYELVAVACACGNKHTAPSPKFTLQSVTFENFRNAQSEMSPASLVLKYICEFYSLPEIKFVFDSVFGVGLFEDVEQGNSIILFAANIAAYARRRTGGLDKLVRAFEVYIKQHPLLGEERNVRCNYCGTIGTVRIQGDGGIVGHCLNCDGQSLSLAPAHLQAQPIATYQDSLPTTVASTTSAESTASDAEVKTGPLTEEEFLELGAQLRSNFFDQQRSQLLHQLGEDPETFISSLTDTRLFALVICLQMRKRGKDHVLWNAARKIKNVDSWQEKSATMRNLISQEDLQWVEMLEFQYAIGFAHPDYFENVSKQLRVQGAQTNLAAWRDAYEALLNFSDAWKQKLPKVLGVFV